jgi:hypothetical protein
LIFAAGLLFASAVQAVPIVTNGSSYNFILFTGPGGGSNLVGPTTFDGLAEVFALNAGGLATVSESQTDLGGDQFQIDLSIVGNAELFPSVLGGSSGVVNIGRASDPLDLTQPFMLTSAILTYTRGNGIVFSSDDFINAVANQDPWDGFFAQSAFAVGFTNAVGQDIRRVDLSLTGRAVPESGSTLAMLGLVTAGLVGVRRRRS